MMKKLFTFSIFAIMAVIMYGQSPQLMSYQAVIRNSANNLVVNKTIGMRLSILKDSITGTSVYTETQTPVTNANGLVSITIGNGNLVSGNFSVINWAKGPYFIKTETDPAGGSNYTISGTSQLLSVPYALYAAQSGYSGRAFFLPKCNESGKGLTISQIFDNGNVGIGDSVPSYKLQVTHGGGTGILSKSTSTYSVIDIDAKSGDAALRFIKDGVSQWNIRNRPGDDYLEIFELGGGGSRLVIQDGTGNVGIGETTNPTYKLDILHAGSSGINVKSNALSSLIDIDSKNGDASLRFKKDGTMLWNIRNNPANNNLQFYETGYGERIRIENVTGKVFVSTDLQAGGTIASTHLKVEGTVTYAAGAMKIDHPSDPIGKYLYHSSVQSPDMMNIYNGIVTTDGSGVITVTLPDYFEALNSDFRYQLTVIGTSFAQAIISQEIKDNKFQITTSLPDTKVSWQVTGIRKDTYANSNRIPVTVNKPIIKLNMATNTEELENSSLYYNVQKEKSEIKVLPTDGSVSE